MGSNQRAKRREPAKLKQSRSLSLGLEQLEERTVMAASISASLNNGILQIQGTSRNDNIALGLSNNQISVSGVSTRFNLSQVQSIRVQTLNGNDLVNLSGLGANFTKSVIITNSQGNDKVVRFNGSQVNLAKGSVTVTPTNTNNGGGGNNSGGGGNTTVTTWFDANINDAALRSLLKTNFADNKLSRTEMLQVFQQVAQDGTVSSTEFSDLQKVANNSSLFTTVEYVGVLAKNVVLGNTANARYQGTTLGNLSANASAAHLNKLVGKWYLGNDTPLAQYGSTTFAYGNASGSLFGANGPQYSDVKQGAVGDCYYVGALGEIALRSPNDIRNMFIVNGDGTYTVRFFRNGSAEFVTVNSQLPQSGGRFIFANYGGALSNSGNVLWVALAEKAYAQLNESGWIRSSNMGGGINSYQAIAGGWFSAAVSHVANKACTTTMFGSGAGNDFNTFRTAFDSGKMIGFASKSSPTSSQIVGGHQYVVVSYNAQTQTVTLFNPWGVNNGSQYAGLVTLNWSDLAASFSYWDRTV
jgi:hypothetical protein